MPLWIYAHVFDRIHWCVWYDWEIKFFTLSIKRLLNYLTPRYDNYQPKIDRISRIHEIWISNIEINYIHLTKQIRKKFLYIFHTESSQVDRKSYKLCYFRFFKKVAKICPLYPPKSLMAGCIEFQVYLKISRLVLTYLEVNLKSLQSLRLP